MLFLWFAGVGETGGGFDAKEKSGSREMMMVWGHGG